MKRRQALSVAAGAVLLLGGCSALDGGTAGASAHEVHATHSTAGPPATTPGGQAGPGEGHAAADVMFLQMMVARQVETTKLTTVAGEGKLSKQAKALVAAISSTEDEERAEMSGWLKAWGEPAQMAGDSDLHAGHGGVSTLTKADLRSLKSAPGKTFQTVYLNLLIAQQSNAIEIARYATENGENAEVLALAGRIDTSRSAQVQQMLSLLSTAG